MEALNARRRYVLDVIVPQVVPSAYGDAKFKLIDANWAPGKGYTTCGGLPAHVANQLGVTGKSRADGITGSGLTSMRDAGIKAGAWVHHDVTLRTLASGMNLETSMNRPKPGDFYMLCSGDISRHNSFCNHLSTKAYGRGAAVEHVGVIVNSTGNVWKTADAGQPSGDVQAALYCDRTFNPSTGLLVGEYDGKGGRPMRRLCGWLDIDKYPFLKYPS